MCSSEVENCGLLSSLNLINYNCSAYFIILIWSFLVFFSSLQLSLSFVPMHFVNWALNVIFFKI